jgi:hypothetical protein
MKLTLVANWRRVLRYAWSIRAMLFAGLLSGPGVTLPLLDGLLPIPPGIFAGLSDLTVAAAFIARLIAQNNVGGVQ